MGVELLLLPLPARLFAFLLLNAFLVAWARATSWWLPPGLPRLLAASPIFAATFLAPALFDPAKEIILYDYCVVCYLWLVNWKVAGLALDRGPLVGRRGGEGTPPVVFAALLLLPVNIRAGKGGRDGGADAEGAKGARWSKSGGTTKDFLMRGSLKVCLVTTLAYITLKIWDRFPLLRDVALVWILFFMVSMVMDVLASISIAVLNLELMPHFERPWLCTSLSDFWGSRWNLVVGKMLRDMIYWPICEGRFVGRPGTKGVTTGHSHATHARQAIGVLATFVVSGVMHALLIMYISGAFGWKNLLYFVVNGCAVLGERLAKDTVGRKKAVRNVMARIPAWMRTVYTLGFLHVTSHFLFWPEVLDMSSDVINTINVFVPGAR